MSEPLMSEQVTVRLLSAIAVRLRDLQERTGMSRTDLINRAITAYDFLDEQMQGKDVILRDRVDGTEQVVHFGGWRRLGGDGDPPST